MGRPKKEVINHCDLCGSAIYGSSFLIADEFGKPIPHLIQCGACYVGSSKDN